MGSTERRARAKVAMRQQILDAARDLFVREGYDAVSMRRIASRIEYSPTAIYLHFPDKASLIYAACDRQFDKLGVVLHEAMDGVDDPIERVVSVMEAHRIRRVPVRNEHGGCAGIIAQADVAQSAPPRTTGELVRKVSGGADA